jgi:hypothetical protein
MPTQGEYRAYVLAEFVRRYQTVEPQVVTSRSIGQLVDILVRKTQRDSGMRLSYSVALEQVWERDRSLKVA